MRIRRLLGLLGVLGGLLFLALLYVYTRPAPTPPPVTTLAFDLVACSSHTPTTCEGIANPTFKIHLSTNPDEYLTVQGDGAGYVFVTGVPATLHDTDITISAEGYVAEAFGTSTEKLVGNNAAGNHNFFDLKAAHFDPSTLTLDQLAHIRAAMWPQGTASSCGALPNGPRPYDVTNIFATTYFASYSLEQQACILDELRRVRGYTHVVVGPLADDGGYHGIWPAQDWRGANFEKFLDQLQTFWDHGLAPIVFMHPDNWSFEQTRDELSGLIQGNARAQKLMRIIVPSGWEPTTYGWSSCTWAKYGEWGRQILPNALVLVHTVTDVDAPAGTDSLCNDDDHEWNPEGNAGAWKRVTPNIHGWLYQSAAFECPTCIGDPNHPDKTNFENWQDNFRCSVYYSYCNRFHNGYAGWPTTSAWGNRPIKIYAGEYAAYWKFWEGRTEAEAVQWGDAGMRAGADGYADSGTVAVPLATTATAQAATPKAGKPLPPAKATSRPPWPKPVR